MMNLQVTDVYKIGQPALVLQNDSFLKITVWNSYTGVAPGLAIRVNYEIITPEGQFKYGQEDIVPTFDYLPNVRFSTLQEGILSKVRVFVSTGTPARGETYVLVELQKSNVAFPLVAQVLIGNYLTSGEALSFPGTAIQDSLSGTGVTRTIPLTPGVFATATYTQPLQSALRLTAIGVVCTAAAAPGNRVIRLQVLTGLAGIIYPVVTSPFAATITKIASWSIFGAPQNSYLIPGGLVNIESLPFPSGLTIRGGDTVVYNIDGFAGDNVTGFNISGEEFIAI